MHREDGDPPVLVCQVGSTTLRYRADAVADLHAWLVEQGDWVPLGAADESRPARRRHGRGVGALRRQPRGRLVRAAQGLPRRFGMYLPPLLAHLGLVELTHDERGNSVRAR